MAEYNKEEGHFSVSFTLKSTDNVVKLFNGYYDDTTTNKFTESNYVTELNDSNEIIIQKTSWKEDDTQKIYFNNQQYLPKIGDIVYLNGLLLKNNDNIPLKITQIETISGDGNKKIIDDTTTYTDIEDIWSKKCNKNSNVPYIKLSLNDAINDIYKNAFVETNDKTKYDKSIYYNDNSDKFTTYNDNAFQNYELNGKYIMKIPTEWMELNDIFKKKKTDNYFNIYKIKGQDSIDTTMQNNITNGKKFTANDVVKEDTNDELEKWLGNSNYISNVIKTDKIFVVPYKQANEESPDSHDEYNDILSELYSNARFKTLYTSDFSSNVLFIDPPTTIADDHLFLALFKTSSDVTEGSSTLTKDHLDDYFYLLKFKELDPDYGNRFGTLNTISPNDFINNKNAFYNEGFSKPLIDNNAESIEIDWTNTSKLCDINIYSNDDDSSLNHGYWIRNNADADNDYGNYNVLISNIKQHNDINTFTTHDLDAPNGNLKWSHEKNAPNNADPVEYNIDKTLLNTRINRGLNVYGDKSIGGVDVPDDNIFPLMTDKGTKDGTNTLSNALSPYLIATRNANNDSSIFTCIDDEKSNIKKRRLDSIGSISGTYISERTSETYNFNLKGSYQYSWLNGCTLWSCPYIDDIVDEIDSAGYVDTDVNSKSGFSNKYEKYIYEKTSNIDWTKYKTDLSNNNSHWSNEDKYSANKIYPYLNNSTEVNCLPIFTSSSNANNFIMNIIKSNYNCTHNILNSDPFYSRQNTTNPYEYYNKIFNSDEVGGNTYYTNYITFQSTNYSNNETDKNIIIDDNLNKYGKLTEGSSSIKNFGNTKKHIVSSFSNEGSQDIDMARQNITDISNLHDISDNRNHYVRHFIKSNNINYNYDDNSNNQYYVIKNYFTENIYNKESNDKYYGNHINDDGKYDISNNFYNDPDKINGNYNFDLVNITYDNTNNNSGHINISGNQLEYDDQNKTNSPPNIDSINSNIIPFNYENKALRVNGQTNILRKDYPLYCKDSKILKKLTNNDKTADIYSGNVYRVSFSSFKTTAGQDFGRPKKDNSIYNYDYLILHEFNCSNRYDSDYSSKHKAGWDNSNNDFYYENNSTKHLSKIICLIETDDQYIQEIYFVSPTKINLNQQNKKFIIEFPDKSTYFQTSKLNFSSGSTNKMSGQINERGGNKFDLNIVPLTSIYQLGRDDESLTDTSCNGYNNEIDSLTINSDNNGLITESQIVKLSNISTEINTDGDAEDSDDWHLKKGSIIYYNKSYGRLLHAVPGKNNLSDNHDLETSVYLVSMNEKPFRSYKKDNNQNSNNDHILVFKTSDFSDKLNPHDYIEIATENDKNGIKVEQYNPNIVIYPYNDSESNFSIYRTDEINNVSSCYNGLTDYKWGNKAVIEINQPSTGIKGVTFEKPNYIDTYSNSLNISEYFSSGVIDAINKGTGSFIVYTPSLTNCIESYNAINQHSLGNTIIHKSVVLNNVKKTDNFHTDDIIFSNNDGTDITDPLDVTDKQSWGLVSNETDKRDNVIVDLATTLFVYHENDLNKPDASGSNKFLMRSKIIQLEDKVIYQGSYPLTLTHSHKDYLENHTVGEGMLLSSYFNKDENLNLLHVVTTKGAFYNIGPIYINNILIGKPKQIYTKYNFKGSLYKFHNNPDNNKYSSHTKVIDKNKRYIGDGTNKSYFSVELNKMTIKTSNLYYKFHKNDVITCMNNNTSDYSYNYKMEMCGNKKTAFAKGIIANDVEVKGNLTDTITVIMKTTDDILLSCPDYLDNYYYDITNDKKNIGTIENGIINDITHFKYYESTKYSILNGLKAWKLRKEIKEADENNPKVPQNLTNNNSISRNVNQGFSYNNLYDLKFVSGSWKVYHGNTNTLIDKDGNESNFNHHYLWEVVEVSDFKDFNNGTNVYLLNLSNEMDISTNILNVANNNTDSKDITHFMIKYKTNNVLELKPDYDYYIFENDKQWNWDKNNILEMVRLNYKDDMNPNMQMLPLNAEKSTLSKILFVNSYKNFSTKLKISTDTSKENDGTLRNLKKSKKEINKYKGGLIQLSNNNYYDDLITFYGNDYPQRGRNEQGMLIDPNVKPYISNEKIVLEDISKSIIDESKYCYNPYNIIDLQWTSLNKTAINNTFKNRHESNAGRTTYICSAESPKFGTQIPARPIKIIKKTGDWCVSSKGTDKTKDVNGNLIEREITVSFNSKTVSHNYNNIQPTPSQIYSKECIYNTDLDIFNDLLRSKFNITSNLTSNLNNVNAKLITCNVDLNNWSNDYDWYNISQNRYAKTLKGKINFNNSWKTKDITLIDDKIFQNFNFDENDNFKYVNISTLQGIKDLSGTGNNDVSKNYFILNNYFDALNSARLISAMSKIGKTPQGDNVNYTNIVKTLNREEIYLQEQPYSVNNWILIHYPGSWQSNKSKIFDNSGSVILIENSKFVNKHIKTSNHHSNMQKNKKMLLFLHYMDNNVIKDDLSLNVFKDNDDPLFIDQIGTTGLNKSQTKHFTSYRRNKFRSIKHSLNIATVPLSLMAFTIGSSRGKKLIEGPSNINFNEKTYSNTVSINKTLKEHNFSISGDFNIDFLIGTSDTTIFIPNNYQDKKWFLQCHSNYWSNGLKNDGNVPYGLSNTGNPKTTVKYKNHGVEQNYDQWGPNLTKSELDNLRTCRLYFKFGNDIKTAYPDNIQSDLQSDPYSEPNSSVAYISSRPEHESNSSNNVYLGNFTGQHRVISDLVDEETNLVGYIVSSIGKVVGHNGKKKIRGKGAININEALPEVELSLSKEDTTVIGVISDKDNYDKYFKSSMIGAFKNFYIKDIDRLIINSLGEGGIWVCNENGNIENGDYLCTSSIQGIGMKQESDIKHSYTVAKSTIDCRFNTNTSNYNCYLKDGVKYAFISCTYHCG